MLLLEKLFPDISIFSFEPIKEEMQIQKKLFSFKNKIIFYDFAIGKKIVEKIFLSQKEKIVHPSINLINPILQIKIIKS